MNATLGQYVPQALFPLTSPLFGLVTASQSLTVRDTSTAAAGAAGAAAATTAKAGQSGSTEWIYFCLRAPEVRVRADQITNLSAYERVEIQKPAAFSSFNRAAVRMQLVATR
jgi:hypothetical protein